MNLGLLMAQWLGHSWGREGGREDSELHNPVLERARG